jgi:RNAse (barnase) inhibitor barstar
MEITKAPTIGGSTNNLVKKGTAEEGGDGLEPGKIIKSSTVLSGKSISSFAKKKLFDRHDSGNLVDDVDLLEQVCDLKRAEFLDPTLEAEFKEAHIRNQVSRNTRVVFFDLFSNILSPVYQIPIVVELVIVFGYWVWGVVILRAGRFGPNVLRYHYHAIILIMFIIFGVHLPWTFGAGFAQLMKSNLDALWRIRYLLSKASFYPFLAAKCIGYRPSAIVSILLITMSAQVIILLTATPYTTESSATLFTIGVYVFVSLKTLLVSAIFRYRVMISERMLYYYDRFVAPPLPAIMTAIKEVSVTPTGFWRLVPKFLRKWKPYLTTPANFNSFHDQAQSKAITNGVFTILAIDLVTSIISLGFTIPETQLPSIVKCGILLASVVIMQLALSKIGPPETAKQQFYINVLAVSLVIADHFAYWLDSTWSVVRVPLDQPVELSNKYASFASVLITNIIGLAATSIRLPFFLTGAGISVAIAILAYPVQLAILPAGMGSYRDDYPITALYEWMIQENTLLIVIVTIIAAFESRALLRLYFKAFQCLERSAST